MTSTPPRVDWRKKNGMKRPAPARLNGQQDGGAADNPACCIGTGKHEPHHGKEQNANQGPPTKVREATIRGMADYFLHGVVLRYIDHNGKRYVFPGPPAPRWGWGRPGFNIRHRSRIRQKRQGRNNTALPFFVYSETEDDAEEILIHFFQVHTAFTLAGFIRYGIAIAGTAAITEINACAC